MLDKILLVKSDVSPGFEGTRTDGTAVFLQRRSMGLSLLGYAGLTLLAYAAFFVGMGDYGIINGNESLYVESAREMALSGRWAIPTLNGLPYLEKPPLLVWLLTGCRLLFGAGEWSMRLTPSVAGFILVFAMVRYSVLLGIGRYGFAAGFILATSLGMDVMSRVAMPDLLLTLLFASASFSYMAAMRHHSLRQLRIGAVLLGLSSLLKGPLSIALFALILLVQYALEPTQRAWMRRALVDPLALLALIAPLSLWLLIIEMQQPGSIYYFIVNEHILRFLGLREPHDYYSGSLFYYVPRLFVFIFPWGGVFLFGWLSSSRKIEVSRRQVRRFLWLCVWIPLGFFSLSSAKANYYILVCLPAIALLTADYLPELLRERRGTHLVLAIAVPIMVFVAIWAYRIWEIRNGLTESLVPIRDGSGALTVVVLIILALTILAFVQFGWRRAAILCIGGLIVPVSFQFDHLVGLSEPIMSSRLLAAYIRSNMPNMPLYLYQDYEAIGSLPIYLDKSLPVIDSKSNDLYFGRKMFPDHVRFISEEQMLACSEDAAIVVMNEREEAFLHSKLASRAHVLTTIGRTKLFSFKPAPKPGRSALE